MRAPTPRANDIVIWRATRWRVVMVTSGHPGVPANLKLMRVVDVPETEVLATGETVDSRRRGARR
jgi:hypothetical protein